jgi:uncharacterized membrane-anchored protein
MANKEVNELIKRNNELRELLTPENKAYYEKILLYMRTYGIFYDDLEIEQHLMVILQDLLEAQKHGESAESFFGKNPKEMMDEMKKQLDRPSWKNIFQIIGLVFLISSFFEVVGSFSAPVFKFNLFTILFNGLFSIFLVYVIFKVLHRGIYFERPWPKFVKFLVIWLSASAIFAVFVLFHVLAPKQGEVTISSPFDWLFTLVVLIFVTIYVFFKRKKEYYGSFVFVALMGLFGIFWRLPQTKTIVEEGVLHQTLIILNIVLPLAAYILVERFVIRKSGE